MVDRGPFGVPALPARRKLILTVAMSLLALWTLVALIIELVTGGSGWFNYLLGVAVMAFMIAMVRRTPTKR